uniref:SFRICE_038383 n=1 Tax=Spodoptera frugiperda TaxID=7108 RepID=A0A2H1WQJ5_SPOFR
MRYIPALLVFVLVLKVTLSYPSGVKVEDGETERKFDDDFKLSKEDSAKPAPPANDGDADKTSDVPDVEIRDYSSIISQSLCPDGRVRVVLKVTLSYPSGVKVEDKEMERKFDDNFKLSKEDSAKPAPPANDGDADKTSDVSDDEIAIKMRNIPALLVFVLVLKVTFSYPAEAMVENDKTEFKSDNEAKLSNEDSGKQASPANIEDGKGAVAKPYFVEHAIYFKGNICPDGQVRIKNECVKPDE